MHDGGMGCLLHRRPGEIMASVRVCLCNYMTCAWTHVYALGHLAEGKKEAIVLLWGKDTVWCATDVLDATKRFG